MSTLPSTRTFVTQLLDTLSSLQQQDVSAEPFPLGDALAAVEKQLLSLQALFPNAFLPALDLLDRKLVTLFIIGSEEPVSTIDKTTTAAYDATTTPSDAQIRDSERSGPSTEPHSDEQHFMTAQRPRVLLSNDTVYYVRSTQQRSSRFSTSYESTMTYEVRLRAWNCTCPAFAFAAFPAVYPEPPLPVFAAQPMSSVDQDSRAGDVGAEKEKAADWVFGGVSLEQGMPPVCKHLLACAMAERCSGVFGKCVEERRASVETAAGWAAGWGDS